MSVAAPPASRTLRDTLVRSRLVHREARLQLVLTALHERIRELDRYGTPKPAPLLAALAGFEEELADVRRRLREGHAGRRARAR